MTVPFCRGYFTTTLLLVLVTFSSAYSQVERPGNSPRPKNLQIDLGGGLKLELMLIPAGSFIMGSKSGSAEFGDEKPAHAVTLSKPFYLGKYEVTQEQWQAVMGNNPSDFKGDKLPVESVSWNECQEFLENLQTKSPGLKFVLPTEAQWEYACRAGSKKKYSYGDDASRLGDYAWYDANSGRTTHDVGGKQPNAWGLYDMHGNIWEWCADWYADNYLAGAQKNPVGPSSGSLRVLRGGSWGLDDDYLRSAVRRGRAPDSRIDGWGGLGFRVAAGT